MPDEVNPQAKNSEGDASKGDAHFLPNLEERLRLFEFLHISYRGGISYKDGADAFGNAVLIEHENEWPGTANSQGLFHRARQAGTADRDQLKQNRYFRRKRIAAYENHVKPIVDKISSYALRNPPKRKEGIQEELERLEFEQFMEDLVCDGLKMSEAWIGWDTAAIPLDAEITEAEAAEIDPENEGKPYLVMMDPRRVVDVEFSIDDPELVVRFVYEETFVIKGSLVAKPQKITRYKEWTPDVWRIYVKEKDDAADKGPGGTKVILKEEHPHDFGRCPWICFKPPFPIEDIAELNRALFNINSLLDEELYNCTFTQKWVTGETPENIKGSEGGTGNTLVIPNPDAKVGVFGAVVGQAQALMDRVNHLRDAIYMIVSMESTNTKNAAETAEKKKRDLEALYTMLVQIVKSVEYVENELLVGLELIDADDTDAQTTYDRKFDVNSIAELQEEIEKLAQMPFVPPTLKRTLATQLAQKLDPFGDHSKYTEEIEKLIAADEMFLKGIEILMTNGLFTPEILADLLGVSDKQRAEFIAKLAMHDAEPDIDDEGNERADDDEDEEDTESDEDDDDEGRKGPNPFERQDGSDGTQRAQGAD